MKKIFTLIISLAVCGIALGTDVTGTIAVNTTWNLLGSPYIVTGNVTVNAGVTLTVDASVQVKFNNGMSLNVNGTLNATSATFTTNDASPAPGKWNYIDFNSGGGGTLSNCTFSYGRHLNIDNGATVSISGSNVNSMSYYGIYNNGALTLSNSTLDLTAWTVYGYGLYSDAAGVSTLNTVSIVNCSYGIFLDGLTQVNLTSVIISSCTWPAYYNGQGSMTVAGVCDFLGNTRNAFYVYPASMTSNWTIPFVNVPYYFRTNFTVNNGTTFTIGNNNIIKFPLYTGLEVRGKILANATAGNTIFFTSERDDNWGGDTNNDGISTAPAISNWYGIRFFDESDNTSILRRCKIRYAGYTSIGGISLYDANPTIDLCELQQNYYGALFQNTSSPTFTNNTIGSSQLTPIAMSFEANPTFTNNVLSFMDNQYDAIGLLGGTLTANANIIKRDFTTVSNITYVMLAQITVPVGRTLTIQPGIVIKSASQTYRIIIEGKLVADATLAERITLTSVKDDNFGNPSDTNKDGTITTPALGDMGAIIFANGYDPTSIMDYVLMKYATAWNYYYPNGGQNHYIYGSAVATISATAPVPAGPTISNCEFRELTYGICSYQASNPTISNNTMINITGTPFAIAASSNATFVGNTFTNVGMNALGLIGNNVVVNGTIIKRNVAGYTNITYVLLEDITVVTGTNLDIAAGVVIKSLSKHWYIDGGFKCNGTLAEHVVMTSLYDDNSGNPMDTNGDGNATTPAPANWYSVQFRDTSNDLYCAFTYTDLKYGGYSSDGILKTLNASPVISNTLIDQSHYGLWIDGNSAPSFNLVTIQNCVYDPIAMSLTSNPAFTNITFSANGSNGIKIIEGTLSSNATLVKRNVAGYTNIPYIVGNLNVASGAVLTLEQGIIIKFRYAGFTGITVQGGLNATGIVSQKIIFTSFKDDSSGGDTNNDGSATIPSNADWYGLLFYPESIDASNKLIYSEVRYTGGGWFAPFGTDAYNGAVRIKDAYVQISNSIFQQGSGTALGIYGAANPAISNCQMYNFTYTPVHMAMFSTPTFTSITVSNVGMLALSIQSETYSQTATISQRSFAGYTNITYLLNGFTINSGTTITVPAGTVFKTQSTEGIIINGKLTVSGTVGSKVVFTDYRDDGYGNPADTQQNGSATSPGTAGPYIQFNDVSDDASTINHAILRYTTDAIRLNSASPSITNCTFNYLNYGITNSGVCTPVVNNNTFDNLYYSPMVISLVSYPASTTGNVISGTTYKCIRVDNETLTQDVTLPKRSFGGVVNIPYFFQTYTIGTGVTLTIAPGVVCKFQYGGLMTVNNGLIAEGTATNAGNIVFTSISDDFHGGDSNSDGTATAYGASPWQGITINDVALDPQTRFANCIFRYAQYSTSAGIKTINASPSILNCSFNNNDQGVQASGASNPTINFCDFYNISGNAVNNVNQSFVINAENCWWGSNTGPTHTGNPGGTGEPVTNSVDYLPFGTSGVINPLMGDVSLNGILQAYDGSLVLQHVLVPFLNAKQQVVADVSGATGITALDASLILQFVVGLINYFPAELLSPAPYYTSGSDLVIGNQTVMPGEEFDLPLQMKNVDGIFAGQLTLDYDPLYLTVLEINNLMPDMMLLSDIDEENGTIKICFAGTESLESDLTFANIHFKANENAPSITLPIEGTFFMANESNLTENISNGSVTINSFATGLENNSTDTDDMLACYPNPVKDELTIDYTVENEGDNVYITVYDLFGQKVAEIVNGKHAAESYKIVWNCNGQTGINVPGGTYFIRMVSGKKTVVQKIQIVR